MQVLHSKMSLTSFFYFHWWKGKLVKPDITSGIAIMFIFNQVAKSQILQ